MPLIPESGITAPIRYGGPAMQIELIEHYFPIQLDDVIIMQFESETGTAGAATVKGGLHQHCCRGVN